MGPVAGLDVCGKSCPPLGFDPWTVQLVTSRYTDWDISALPCFAYCYLEQFRGLPQTVQPNFRIRTLQTTATTAFFHIHIRIVLDNESRLSGPRLACTLRSAISFLLTKATWSLASALLWSPLLAKSKGKVASTCSGTVVLSECSTRAEEFWADVVTGRCLRHCTGSWLIVGYCWLPAVPVSHLQFTSILRSGTRSMLSISIFYQTYAV